MPLRCRCLNLDHDDTAVNSTATVHYPAHLVAYFEQPAQFREFILS